MANTAAANTPGFTLTCPGIPPGGRLTADQVFNGFGCTGANVSPALNWSGAPAGTKSYALTCYDPDAPTGSGWWHWIMIDIPPGVAALAAGAGDASGKGLPPGARHGRSDFGSYAFGGACPPEGHGDHHYHFTLYALSVDKLELPNDASAALIGYMVNHTKLGQTGFMATFSR